MHRWMEQLVAAGAMAGQFLFGFLAIYLLLRLLPQRRPRWLHLAALKRREPSERWLRLARIARNAPGFVEREALLAGCGVTADAAWYVLGRRLLLLALSVAVPFPYLVSRFANGFALGAGPAWYGIGLSLLIMLHGDLPWLRSLRRLRAHQITKEIYVISNQLLYLADSSLHIHAKLMRCVPFSRTIRSDLERLLAEWYHDAEQALRSFKRRIGTDEGMSFVETIDALRLHESEEYYQLLRERIQDYKEKLELAKEGRKETSSYVLFVLAGVPILYTFQVFIYPWVREGQKLFDSLG